MLDTTSNAQRPQKPRDINEVLDEARDILAGRSCLSPTREHLKALHDSSEFWRYIAQDPDRREQTAPTRVIGVRSQCERCGHHRATYSTVARKRVYLCDCCAQKSPEYVGGVQ